MKSQLSLQRPKKLKKLLLVRRVNGISMEPSIKSGRVIVGYGWYSRLKPGMVIIFNHRGMEKIKRIVEIENNRLFVVGDNSSQSTDSRHFGWIKREQVVAKVVVRRSL